MSDVYYFFRNIPYRLKKLWVYGKFILFEDFDWDHVYLLKLIEIKLSFMETSIRNGYANDALKKSEKIKICKTLCKRLQELNGYCELEWEQYYDKWGELRIVKGESFKDGSCTIDFVHDNEKTKEDREKSRKESMNIVDRENYLREQDKEYLFKLMNKYLFHWWD